MRNRVLLLLLLLLSLLSGCNVEKNESQTILITLTSAKFEGRAIGSAGNQKAAEYIADYFAEFGLEPWQESYLHDYPCQVLTETQPQQIVTLVSGGTENVLKEGIDFTCSPVMEAFEGTLSGAELTETSETSAVRVLFTDDPHGGVSSIGAEQIKLQLNSAYETQLAEGGAALKVKLSVSAGQGEALNVVAVRPGTSGRNAILVCAHFDGSGMSGETLFPSAYDNASGTTALMRIAAHIAAQEGTAENDLLFAALNGEETGMSGSQALAAELSEAYASVAVINIDCIGAKDDTGIAVIGQVADQRLRDAVELINFGRPVTTWLDQPSDQRSFSVYENMTAVSVGDNDFLMTEENGTMHGTRDTVEALDSAFLEEFALALSGFVWEQKDRQFEKISANTQSVEDETTQLYDNLELIRQQRLREGLQYDEAFCYYHLEQDTRYLLCGIRTFRDMEDLSTYYPQIHPVTVIGDYHLVEAAVETASMEGISFVSRFDNSYQAGETYQMNWAEDPIRALSFGYQNDDGQRLLVTYRNEKLPDTLLEGTLELQGYYANYDERSNEIWTLLLPVDAGHVEIEFGGWQVRNCGSLLTNWNAREPMTEDAADKLLQSLNRIHWDELFSS